MEKSINFLINIYDNHYEKIKLFTILLMTLLYISNVIENIYFNIYIFCYGLNHTIKIIDETNNEKNLKNILQFWIYFGCVMILDILVESLSIGILLSIYKCKKLFSLLDMTNYNESNIYWSNYHFNDIHDLYEFIILIFNNILISFEIEINNFKKI